MWLFRLAGGQSGPQAEGNIESSSVVRLAERVTPQDLRFVTKDDVTATVKILDQYTSSSSASTTTPNVNNNNEKKLATQSLHKSVFKFENITKLPDADVDTHNYRRADVLEDTVRVMLSHNKFQDVLSQVPPDVLAVALQAVIAQRKQDGREKVFVSSWAAAAVGHVGKMMYDRPVWKTWTLPFVSEDVLHDISVELQRQA